MPKPPSPSSIVNSPVTSGRDGLGLTALDWDPSDSQFARSYLPGAISSCGLGTKYRFSYCILEGKSSSDNPRIQDVLVCGCHSVSNFAVSKQHDALDLPRRLFSN